MAEEFLKEEARQKALSFLSQNRLMALGTEMNGKPWVCTVFFAFDEDFRLFFYSDPKTLHCENIANNENVSCVINHQWKSEGGGIRGIQLSGTAEKVSEGERKDAYELFQKRFRWADDYTADHVLYKITPDQLWYLDTEFFGHFYRVPLL